jgi:hypothetical protein
MEKIEEVDQRIRGRLLARRKLSPAELERSRSKLPDLADQVARRSDEEIRRFREALEPEREARTIRVQRAVARRNQPTVRIAPPQLEPFDEGS